MKARTPINVRQTALQQRQYMVWLQMLLSCYTLHKHFGFGKKRLLMYLHHNGRDATEVAGMGHGYAENRTWMDELWHWGETMGLNDVITGKYKEDEK